MKKFQEFVKRLFKLRNLPAALSIATAVFGGIFVTDTNRQFQLLLIAIGILAIDAIVERLEVLSNIEEDVKSTSAAVREIKNAIENVEMNVIVDDSQIPDIIQNLTSRVTIKEVQILSSGLTSRQIMIAKLLEKGIRVQALMQDPATALDKRDPDRISTALEWIEHHNQFIQSSLFEARYHVNVSTVRAIVVSEANTDVKHIFLSWYYYENKNSKVRGDTNPTIYCTTLSEQGNKIYGWLAMVFEKDLRESRKITAKDYRKK